MRFACVEFITKGGDIWRHSSGRPNYLADHLREIDATSYGTWTSALQGEHVPLHWFISGRPGPGIGGKFGLRLRAEIKWNRWRGRSSVSFDNIGYLNNFDIVLVCFHASMHRIMREFVEAARAASPALTMLGTHATFGVGLAREKWKDAEWFNDLRLFMNACDVFAIANLEAKDYFSLVSKTPVVYLPQFYPVSYTQKYFRPRESKVPVIFVSGPTNRTDIVWSCLLARELQRRFPQFEIQVTGSKGFNFQPLEGARYRVLPRMGWEEYLDVTSRAHLILNTDSTWTNGRVQADAAAVGTPCIGVNAGRQTELFPELACPDIGGTGQALGFGARLIQDEGFYRQIAADAFARLDQWSYERGPAKLDQMISAHRAGSSLTPG